VHGGVKIFSSLLYSLTVWEHPLGFAYFCGFLCRQLFYCFGALDLSCVLELWNIEDKGMSSYRALVWSSLVPQRCASWQRTEECRRNQGTYMYVEIWKERSHW
jgi:hypothetical protein